LGVIEDVGILAKSYFEVLRKMVALTGNNFSDILDKNFAYNREN